MNDEEVIQVEEGQAGDVRQRIIVTTAALIAAGGPNAATTRAIAAGAGVQAPTIYRLFGDKRGLLDAVVDHGLTEYIASKAGREPDRDPVQELRKGWDDHVAFGLDHPGLFAIMTGDPHPPKATSASVEGLAVLRRRVRNIALAGRLRVSEARAVALVQSAGVGTILTLLSQPEERRDLGLSTFAREAVMIAITSELQLPVAPGAHEAATTLRGLLNFTSVLTGGERHLLEELLDRIADSK